jgi:hypothetical protein
MVHGLNPKVAQGGANSEGRKQESARRNPRLNGKWLISAIHRLVNPLVQGGANVAQRWRKVAQQGGRCATYKPPPKEGGFGRKWRSPQVRLQRWRNVEGITP